MVEMTVYGGSPQGAAAFYDQAVVRGGHPAPIAVRFSAMTSMRLDSLTFSSAASRMMVVPSAKQAITAMTGSSSISVGIRLPSITQPFREELRTRRSGGGLSVRYFMGKNSQIRIHHAADA